MLLPHCLPKTAQRSTIIIFIVIIITLLIIMVVIITLCFFLTSRAGEAGGRKFPTYKNYSSLSLSFLDSFSPSFFLSSFLSFLPPFFPFFYLSFLSFLRLLVYLSFSTYLYLITYLSISRVIYLSAYLSSSSVGSRFLCFAPCWLAPPPPVFGCLVLGLPLVRLGSFSFLVARRGATDCIAGRQAQYKQTVPWKLSRSTTALC